jgi:hypothetical protein
VGWASSDGVAKLEAAAQGGASGGPSPETKWGPSEWGPSFEADWGPN